MAGVAEPSPGDAARARELRRARAMATGLLGLMALVFVAARLAASHWPTAAPTLGYVAAFAEAGMIGGFADWFAVTALFRRPLGLPIPHTGIIPRNKDRIGQALGGFIADNFLTEAVLQGKLRQIEVARWGGEWLRRPENAQRVARRLAAVLPRLLAAAPAGTIGELAGSAALAAARAAPAGPTASRLLGAVWSEGRAQALLDRGVDLGGRWLAEHQEAIREKVSEHSYKWLPRWVDAMLAAKITEGLVKVAEEMRDPAHPWRQALAAWVERQITALAEDPRMRERAEVWKQRLLDDPRLRAQAAEWWRGVEQGLGDSLTADPRALADRLEAVLERLGAWLAEETAAQARLNAWARTLATRVIAPRRQEIGQFVSQVVAGWDARSVVDKLELQVGKDLQYIRVNGALVGGLAGLILYALAQATGLR